LAATITAYGVGKFIHVLAVVLAFGPTFGYAFFMGFADTKVPASVPTVLRSAQLSDRFLVTPAMIVVLLAGIYLLADGDISAGESWVAVGFAAIIVLFGMVHGFFAPRYRKGIALAERDLQAGNELSDEYRAISRQIARGGQIAGLLIAVTIFFMVVQP
jgi:uncharacterized membrane protein